jgi:hypothetical protein
MGRPTKNELQEQQQRQQQIDADAALEARLTALLDSKDEASQRFAAEKRVELRLSRERLELAALTAQPLKDEIRDLQRQLKELNATADASAVALAEANSKILELQGLVGTLTQERDVAAQSAKERGDKLDSLNRQQINFDNHQRVADEKTAAAAKALSDFQTGATAFIRTLSVDPDSLGEIVVKTPAVVPPECLIAVGCTSQKAEEILRLVAMAKSKSTEQLIHACHLDGCKCRWAGDGDPKPAPTKQQVRVFKGILATRGVNAANLQQQITLLQAEHNPRAALPYTPADIPAVVSLEERMGKLTLPSPAPAPKSPLDCSRHWIEVNHMSEPERFRRFVEDMELHNPQLPRDRAAFDKLTAEGRSQCASS